MTPFKHSACNTALGSPKGWNAEEKGECLSLPVHRGDGFFFSYWKLTIRERIQLLRGKPIRLCIHGSGHPPVWIDVEKEAA